MSRASDHQMFFLVQRHDSCGKPIIAGATKLEVNFLCFPLPPVSEKPSSRNVYCPRTLENIGGVS